MEAAECSQNGVLHSENPLQCAMEKQGKSSGDVFLVEDLLDFSNEDEELCDGDDEVVFEQVPKDSVFLAFDSSSRSSSVSGSQFTGELGCHGFSLPHEDLEELEWLSNFVEESFSGDDLQRLQLISGTGKSSSPAPSGGVSEISGDPPATQVPGKARSKRARQAPTDWSSRLLAPPDPKTGKKDTLNGPDPINGPDGRKCMHCATDKTPQWRTGPMGPKTLCNACGVRFKSGRLVPEYRPAASPTFVPAQHSNSHRKVLELRRQKEVIAPPPPPPPPPSAASRPLQPCGSYQHSPAAAAAADFRQLI